MLTILGGPKFEGNAGIILEPFLAIAITQDQNLNIINILFNKSTL